MEAKLSIPTTEIGKSYWNETALYQGDYSDLCDALLSFDRVNLLTEVLSAANCLTYEYCNNGNCNAYETKKRGGRWVECPTCGGLGVCRNEDDEDDLHSGYDCPECCGDGGWYNEEEDYYELSPYYANLIQLIKDFFRKEMPEAVCVMDNIENTILSSVYGCSFNETEERPYVLMMDALVYILKNRVLPEIPEWYKNEQDAY